MKCSDMSCMFYRSSALKSIDLSNFNPNHEVDVSDAFFGCPSLEEIKLPKEIKLHDMLNLDQIFFGCSKELKMKI